MSKDKDDGFTDQIILDVIVNGHKISLVCMSEEDNDPDIEKARKSTLSSFDAYMNKVDIDERFLEAGKFKEDEGVYMIKAYNAPDGDMNFFNIKKFFNENNIYLNALIAINEVFDEIQEELKNACN